MVRERPCQKELIAVAGRGIEADGRYAGVTRCREVDLNASRFREGDHCGRIRARFLAVIPDIGQRDEIPSCPERSDIRFNDRSRRRYEAPGTAYPSLDYTGDNTIRVVHPTIEGDIGHGKIAADAIPQCGSSLKVLEEPLEHRPFAVETDRSVTPQGMHLTAKERCVPFAPANLESIINVDIYSFAEEDSRIVPVL
ncbi:MAG: hypothetical protein A4E65_01975 [Syntrophorhabdus sp. PtaU1.Bin153]|nr:MAG: hypothetical protein A4E65_01975 [Syntrophorhabdus sp. PtaU1.Bin153]